jgi:hypothetical protein
MECLICYNDCKKEKLCPTCDCHLCEDCWYEKCKTFCPICDREHLNTLHECIECKEHHLVKDIDLCYMCDDMVCGKCLVQHKCNNIGSHLNFASFQQLQDVLDKYSTSVENFAYLGKIKLHFTDVHVTKIDYNKIQFFASVKKKNYRDAVKLQEHVKNMILLNNKKTILCIVNVHNDEARKTFNRFQMLPDAPRVATV